MRFFKKIKRNVQHVARNVERTAERTVQDVENTATQTANQVAETVEKEIDNVSNIAEQALKSIEGDVKHLTNEAKGEISKLAKEAKGEIRNLADDAKVEINALAKQAKAEIHKAFDEILEELEDDTLMFVKAVENGLIQKGIHTALEELKSYPVLPISYDIGFEFWNVGFAFTIDNIPERIPVLEEYVGHSPKTADEIQTFALALSPTSLSATVLGTGPTFGAQQIADGIRHILAKFGIK